MENKEIRRANLTKLIKDWGSAAALAKDVDTDETYLRNIVNKVDGRGLGDKVARRIEEKLGKATGWMDTIQAGPLRAEQAIAPYNVSDKALEIARRFEQLAPECQDHVRRQIELLRGVAAGDSGRRAAAGQDWRIKHGEVVRNKKRRKRVR